MSDFKIICGTSKDIEREVSTLMKEGWELHGSSYTSTITSNIPSPFDHVFIKPVFTFQKCQNLQLPRTLLEKK